MTVFIFFYISFTITFFVFLDHGMREINIFFQRADGNLLIQQKVTINIQYRIKIRRKIKFDKFLYKIMFVIFCLHLRECKNLDVQMNIYITSIVYTHNYAEI